MKETALNRLIHKMENLLLEAELHRVFKKQVMPIAIEKKLKVPKASRTRYQ